MCVRANIPLAQSSRYIWSLISFTIRASCRPYSFSQLDWVERYMPENKKKYFVGLSAIHWRGRTQDFRGGLSFPSTSLFLFFLLIFFFCLFLYGWNFSGSFNGVCGVGGSSPPPPHSPPLGLSPRTGFTLNCLQIHCVPSWSLALPEERRYSFGVLTARGRSTSTGSTDHGAHPDAAAQAQRLRPFQERHCQNQACKSGGWRWMRGSS